MDFTAVNRSPLNTSKTKQMYTFSKAKRWVDPKDNICPPIYQLPTTLSKRAAGIGLGKKMNVTQEIVSPAPNSYSIQTTREHGWTMGLGRDRANKFESIFLGLVQKTPGPGSYNSKETQSKVRYSMRQRLKSRTSKDRKPGPYSYEPILVANMTYQPAQTVEASMPSVNIASTVCFYRIASSGAIVLSPPKVQSDRKIRDNTPGPGTYKETDNLDPLGSYFCSRFGASKCNIFPRAQRILSENREGSPGPGQYKLPSDFGC